MSVLLFVGMEKSSPPKRAMMDLSLIVRLFLFWDAKMIVSDQTKDGFAQEEMKLQDLLALPNVETDKL